MFTERFLPDFADQLVVKNRRYTESLLKLWKWWFEADSFDSGVKKFSVPGSRRVIKARLLAKESGMLAGGEELVFVVRKLFPKVKLEFFFLDGDEFRADDVILMLEGPQEVILLLERTLVNFLARLSGIATKANRLVSLVENIEIAATRKTLWSLLDKKAAAVGGALTHRLSYKQALMIKDNDWGWFGNLIGDDDALDEFCHNVKGFGFVEIEIENDAQLDLVQAFAENYLYVKKMPPLGVMFDNWSVRELEGLLPALAPEIFREASGGITEATLKQYDIEGLDFVSLGCLTKNNQAIDLSLELANM